MATLQISAINVIEDGDFIQLPISRSNPPFAIERFDAKNKDDVKAVLLKKRRELQGKAVSFSIKVLAGRSPAGFNAWYQSSRLTIMRANELADDAAKWSADDAR